MIGKMHPAEEVDAGSDSLNTLLVFVYRKAQTALQKITDCLNESLKVKSVVRHDYKIVGVSHVILLAQFVFDKLIQFVHVDVDENLRCKITEGNSNAVLDARETIYYFSAKIT